MVEKLFDAPPRRSELSFQTKISDNPPMTTAPKQFLGIKLGDSSDETSIQNLYCMVHGDFTSIPGNDIEHAISHSEILKNQKAFLDFLNDPSNKAFVDPFLKVDGISDFFKKESNGKVKGTGYFYKICYNNIENLWLICHACNIEKTDLDSLKWCKEQKKYFGQP